MITIRVGDSVITPCIGGLGTRTGVVRAVLPVPVHHASIGGDWISIEYPDGSFSLMRRSSIIDTKPVK